MQVPGTMGQQQVAAPNANARKQGPAAWFLPEPGTSTRGLGEVAGSERLKIYTTTVGAQKGHRCINDWCIKNFERERQIIYTTTVVQGPLEPSPNVVVYIYLEPFRRHLPLR